MQTPTTVAYSTSLPTWLKVLVGVVLGVIALVAVRYAVRRHGAARWVDPRRYRRRDVLLPALVAGGLVLALVALSLDVAFDGWITSTFDQPVHDWFVAHRNPGLTPFVVVFTNLVSPTGTTILAIALAALVAGRTGSWLPALLVFVGPALAGLLVRLLKFLTPRVRPPEADQVVLTIEPSYPSGHVTGAASLYGCFLVVVLAGFLGAVSKRLAVTAVVAALLLVAAVAWSRLYLGVHWFTDVTAGALLGALVTAATLAAYRELTRRRTPVG